MDYMHVVDVIAVGEGRKTKGQSVIEEWRVPSMYMSGREPDALGMKVPSLYGRLSRHVPDKVKSV